jgi:hypothetical protein
MDDQYRLPDLPAGVGVAILAAAAILLLLVFPLIAAVVAPDDRRGTFFLLTLLILPGPIGVALAAIANPRTIESFGASPSAGTGD